MSYFGSLARQTGVRLAGRSIGPAAPATSSAPSIEVEETCIAPPAPAAAASRPIASPPLASAEPLPHAPPARLPETPLPIAVKPQPPAGEGPPQPAIREVIVEVEAPQAAPTTREPAPVAVTQSTSPAEPPDPPVAPQPTVDPPKSAPTPERRALPTLAEVRKWVAKPLLESPADDPFEPLPSPPMLVPRAAAPVAPARPETPDSYTVEIGSINITFDPPSQAPVPAQPAARSSAPAVPSPSEGRASRYYIRI